MDKYYIDLSFQSSSVLLNNNYPMIPIQNNSINNSNFNNNGDIIEGFGNFGRVNLQKCCPLEYMWSEGQKKCVKICDGCAIGAYGNINYEFLDSNGEFMSFATCFGDASGAYDFDKINRRYGADELLTQHDLNHHIDSDPSASGVQPSEENPWAAVSSKVMYTSSTKQQTSIRNVGHYAADAQEAYLQSIGQESEYLDNRVLLCSTSTDDILITSEEGTTETQYQICTSGSPNEEVWNSLCGLDDNIYTTSLNFDEICSEDIEGSEGNNDDIIDRLCDEDNRLIKNQICPDNR